MWMVWIGVGAFLGLASLVGLIWAFRKLEAPKKWGAVVGFLVLGALGSFLAANATAFGGTGDPEVEIPVEDFDAPLDDDF